VPQMYSARRFEVDLYDYPRLVRIDAALRRLEPIALAAPEAVHVG
jgi:maleylacetoacetate isomerase